MPLIALHSQETNELTVDYTHIWVMLMRQCEVVTVATVVSVIVNMCLLEQIVANWLLLGHHQWEVCFQC